MVTLYCGGMTSSMLTQNYRYPPMNILEHSWDSNMTVLVHHEEYIKYFAAMFNKSDNKFKALTNPPGR